VSGWNKFFVSRPGLDYSSAEGNKFGATHVADAVLVRRRSRTPMDGWMVMQ